MSSQLPVSGNADPGSASETDDIDFLAEEVEVSDEVSEELKGLIKDEEGEEEEEEKEVPSKKVKEDKETEEEEEETEEETEEEFEGTSERPSYKEIVTKYPKLFKDFPGLRHSIFREIEYSRLFPTVEDAKTAHQDKTVMDTLGESLIGNGDPDPLFQLLSKAPNNALPRVVSKILPTLYEKAPALYSQMVEPVFRNALIQMYNEAAKHESVPVDSEGKPVGKYTNSQKAALLFAKFFDIDLNKKPEPEPEEDEEKVQLRSQLENQARQVYMGHVGELSKTVDRSLTQMIVKRLDPNTRLPQVLREAAVEKGLKIINSRLEKDDLHNRKMRGLWDAARRSGYSEESKASIKSAFLARSRALLDSVVSELAKGLRKGPNPDIKKAPKGARLGVGTTSRPGKVTSAKELNKSGMSDADFLSQ